MGYHQCKISDSLIFLYCYFVYTRVSFFVEVSYSTVYECFASTLICCSVSHFELGLLLIYQYTLYVIGLKNV